MLCSLYRVPAMMVILASCGGHAAPAQAPESVVVANTAPPVAAREFGVQYVGNPDASVILDYFYDYECPPCVSLSPAIEELGNRYGDSLLIRYHPFPIPYHQQALPAALAAEAARRQGQFVRMHYGLMELDGKLSPASVRQLAVGLALDMNQFNDDLADPSALAEVDRSRDVATKLGLEGVPSIYLGENPLDSFTLEDLVSAVDAEFSKQGL